MAGAQLFSEVPSGIASDRLGRTKTLMVAASARLVAWLLIGLSSSLIGFLCGFFFLGTAVAFESGTDSAFLFDTLRERNESYRYGNLEARSYQLGLFSMGCANLLGGFLMVFGFQIPILATIPPMIIYLGSTIFLKEPSFQRARSTTEFLSQLRTGLKQIIANQSLCAITAIAVCIIAACEIYFRFVQQFITGNIGVAPTYLGSIYFFWLLVSVLASRIGQSSRFQSRPLFTILMCALTCGSSFIFLGTASVAPIVLLAATILPQSAYGIVPTVFRSELNRELTSSVRATVLSVFGLGTSSVLVVGGFLCGWVATTYSTGAAFMGEGAAIIIVAILGLWISLRSRERETND
jgi:MFS family permease